MSDLFVIYGFIGLMTLNILASFVYLMGLDQMRTSVQRVYRQYASKSPPAS